MYTYRTHGTCSTAIEIETDGDVVRSVRFIDGCIGNTQGVATGWPGGADCLESGHVLASNGLLHGFFTDRLTLA